MVGLAVDLYIYKGWVWVLLGNKYKHRKGGHRVGRKLIIINGFTVILRL